MTNIFDHMTSAQNSEHGSPSELSNRTESNVADQVSTDTESTGTSTAIKSTVQDLLRNGFIEESERGDLFQRARIHHRELNAILESLDLELKIDSQRGIAFLAVVRMAAVAGGTDDLWTHPLVRRQRLTLEQSLLIAHLRHLFVLHEQEYGVGQRPAKVAADDLVPT